MDVAFDDVPSGENGGINLDIVIMREEASSVMLLSCESLEMEFGFYLEAV